MTHAPQREPIGDHVRVKGGVPVFPQAVRWGNLVFCSGQAPVDPDTLMVTSDDFESQARFVLEKTFAILRQARSAPEHVVSVDCYLARAEDFGRWNDLYVEHFPTPRPARTTLVSDLVVPGMLVEIRVIAGVPE